MLISHKEKFCFLHNPKCAGTTIRSSLARYCENNYYWMFEEIGDHRIDKAHMRAELFERIFQEDYSKVLTYFTFGIVRNPYDRAVSAFNEIHKDKWRNFKNGSLSEIEYMEELNSFVLNINRNKVSGKLPRFRHSVRQRDIFYNKEKCVADLIIKLEEIDHADRLIKPFNEEISKVATTWKSNKKNVKKNKVKYITLLKDSAIKHINLFYQDDFYIFRYEQV